jgi:hypothetical protein
MTRLTRVSFAIREIREIRGLKFGRLKFLAKLEAPHSAKCARAVFF